MALLRTDIKQPWHGERIPPGDLLHPINIEQLWTPEALKAFGLVPIIPFVPPEGYQIKPGSEPTYTEDGHEIYPIEPIPPAPPVPKDFLSDAELELMLGKSPLFLMLHHLTNEVNKLKEIEPLSDVEFRALVRSVWLGAT